MAFGFGRKKAANEGASEAVEGSSPQAAAASAKPKKRKPNEMLSSVIKESTEGAAVALMRSNAPFLIEGGSKAVILLLDVATIGGLSQKQRGDENKGSIIELIQADHITTVATAGMLEEDIFGIIPTQGTIERMDEYDLLVNAPYTWAIVDLASFSIAEGSPATFSQAKQVSEDLLTIEQAMGSAPSPYARPAEDPAPTMAMPAAQAGSVGSDDVDYGDDDADVYDAPDLDDLPAAAAPASDEPAPFDDEDDVDYGEMEDDEPFEESPFDDGDEFDPDADYGDEPFEDEEQDGVFDSDGEYEDSGEADYEPDDREVSETEIEDTIARRYLFGDLGLEVDLAPFDAFLGTHEPIALFSEESDHEDWLGNQIAQMAKQANAEIWANHQRGLNDLRQQYQSLMGMHVESIAAQLDPENPSTLYGGLKQAAIDDHHNRAGRADEIAAGRKHEIRERFEAELRERADAAAQAARIQYKDRNQPRLDRELNEVVAQVASQNDDVLAAQQEHLLATRRADAAKRMDLGINRILEALGERHRIFVDNETKLYEQHSKRMQNFLDDFRKEDLARSHALQEELARHDKVEAAGREYAARMDAASSEHRSELARLNGEIDKLHADARERMAQAENHWRGLLEVEAGNTKAASTRADEINQRLSLVQARTDEQYKDRIAAMDEERQRAVNEAERATAMGNRGGKMLAIIGLVMSVAALVLGILIGIMYTNAQGKGAVILPTHVIEMFQSMAAFLS